MEQIDPKYGEMALITQVAPINFRALFASDSNSRDRAKRLIFHLTMHEKGMIHLFRVCVRNIECLCLVFGILLTFFVLRLLFFDHAFFSLRLSFPFIHDLVHNFLLECLSEIFSISFRVGFRNLPPNERVKYLSPQRPKMTFPFETHFRD